VLTTCFRSAGGADWYDLSLVDGFNLPIAIVREIHFWIVHYASLLRQTNDKGCVSPECQADLNTGCPAQLSVHDASGQVEGCSSACDANLSGDPSNSPNCCNGSFDVSLRSFRKSKDWSGSRLLQRVLRLESSFTLTSRTAVQMLMLMPTMNHLEVHYGHVKAI